MPTKIGINGFGRIGRMVFRAALSNPEVEVVAINNSRDAKTLAHLLKYDSVHGTLPLEVKAEGDNIVVAGKTIKVLSNRDPKMLDWNSVGAEIIIEATGAFNDGEKAVAHLGGSVKKVIITAPAKNDDITIVMGVNESLYDSQKHHVISNASCTTNCLAPVAKVIHENFGIKQGMMTTVHAYTNDQNILDAPHKDLRRARAGAGAIIPTTTGAAKAVALVLPELKGKLNGFAMRVPTQNVSVVDLVVKLEKSNVTAEEINAALKKSAEGELKGVLGYCDEPLVSIDFNGNKNSSIVDSMLTMVMEDGMAKIVSWYDNEWGYSCRVVDLAIYIAKTLDTVAEYPQKMKCVG